MGLYTFALPHSSTLAQPAVANSPRHSRAPPSARHPRAPLSRFCNKLILFPMAPHPRAFINTLLWLTASTCGFASAAQAEDILCPGLASAMSEPPGTGEREVFVSNYSKHWTPSDEHKRVLAMSVQQNLRDKRFCGLSLFTNSFGQPSVYVFVGKTWPHPVPAIPKLFASVSAGVLYGYVSPYQNKVPMNVGGFSPAVVPMIGYQVTPNLSVQTHWLGFAAVMFGASLRY